jgi:quercetin dioxygenase-like cupin family protein
MTSGRLYVARQRAIILGASFAALFFNSMSARAQDAVQIDSKHYKVEFENDQLRVLRAVYGPHEKSTMHAHPEAVAVYLTDGHIRITLPDGRTGEPFVKAGQTMWHGASAHMIENLGDTPFELVLTEFKATPTVEK